MSGPRHIQRRTTSHWTGSSTGEEDGLSIIRGPEGKENEQTSDDLMHSNTYFSRLHTDRTSNYWITTTSLAQVGD